MRTAKKTVAVVVRPGYAYSVEGSRILLLLNDPSQEDAAFKEICREWLCAWDSVGEAFQIDRIQRK